MPNQQPRLTTALREFGDFCPSYGNEDKEQNKSELHELPSCKITWDELQVICRESCKNTNKIKHKFQQLLQQVGKIVGTEENVETKKSVLTLLISLIYNVESVTMATLQHVRENVTGQITRESLNEIVKAVRQLMPLGSEVTDRLDDIMNEPVRIFGEKYKFSCELPKLELSTDVLMDDDDDFVDKEDAVVSSFQHAMNKTTQQSDSNQQREQKETKVSSNCGQYKWLCDCMEKKYGGSPDILKALMSLLKSKRGDSEIQEELCELLGFEEFEMILNILQNRNQIVQEGKVSDARQQMEAIKSAQQGGGQSLQVAILTAKEKENEKNMRKVEKKLKKIIDKNSTGDNPNMKFDLKKMKDRRNEELLSPFEQATNMDRGALPAELLEKMEVGKLQCFPHVYDKSRITRSAAAAQFAGIKIALPEGSERNVTTQYEEYKFPPSRKVKEVHWDRVPINQLDDIAQQAFKGTKELNTIQSCVYPTAYHTNENMLICAPTGAGKTNVAMLTIVREIMQNIENGVLKKDNFKIIYIAPMKALACEMADNFGKRLSPLGVSVRELTGDTQLTKTEIANTQMMIVTPEKWDVVTRKSTGDVALARLVRLLIIDEVHLLHDERGPVLETIVARTLRQVEQQQSMIRIVGLSATLPNYIDVANFLRVNPWKGLFFFDGRFRPVPLQQSFIGVKSSSVAGQNNQMNIACYDVVAENLKNGQQVLVFVHARNATVVTGKMLAQMSRDQNETNLFDCRQMTGYDDATRQVSRSRNKILHELFRQGVGVHHAGLLRSDRRTMEKLFSQGFIRVLCCTSTLAWGVNLPAHAVVIKGTQYYDAKQGAFVDIGILDVMQIFGRAGRPQFDTTGEGTIITTHGKLAHYIGLMTRQNPIESQFIEKLVDNLNAEISLGTVNTLDEAVKWLSYTYLFVRIRKNPMVYGIGYEQCQADIGLRGWQRDLIKSKARHLDKLKMIRFDERNGYFHPTDLGRTASHFYIKYESIETYNSLITPDMDVNGILAMICKSSEFSQIKVRDDEMRELDDLMNDYCPASGYIIAEDSDGKTNILFQTFVSNGQVNSFSLSSDLTYISQNASRIVRAIFDIVLKRGLARLTSRVLKLCKCVDKKMWPWDSELRQFGPRLSGEILRKIEDKKLSLEMLRDLSSGDIGNLLHHPHIGSKVKTCVDEIPNVQLEATIQPITRTILKINLTIIPQFNWNNHAHGSKHEPFWVWIEDPDTDHMYHSEYFLLHRKQVIRGEEQKLVFTIPLVEPHPTQYMVYIESDRWFGSSAVCPISFQHLILPERHPPHTELLDLEPLPVTALQEEKFVNIYKFTHFNPIQTQIFHTIYHNDTNVLLGAPTGSGKTVAGELALFRMLRTQPGCKAVYIAPMKALVRERMKDWQKRLVNQLNISLVELTGDVAPDMKAVAKADVIITTPEKWDGISRSWNTRNYVRKVSLLIIDEIHLIGQDRGPVLEVIVSRTSFISQQTNQQVRIIGLSTALANARDLADWLGIKQMGLFNFRPSVRPVPMETHIHGFAGKHYCPRMALMNKPCYQAIKTHSPNKPTLIFVSSRRQTRLTALDLISYLAAEDNPKQWLQMDEEQMEELSSEIRDSNLRFTLSFGIGLHHAGLMERDRSIVEDLFRKEKILTLVATSTLAWGVNLPAHLVVVKGTEFYDGKMKRYQDFPITDVLQMMGRAGRPQFDDKAVAVILVHDVKKAFYKKFLYEPFPVESSLLEVVEDHLNAEFVAGTVCNNQEAIDYLTWTYFFRRLLINPTYYNLIDTDHDSVNLYLSNLLQKSLSALQLSGCIDIPDDDDVIEATNLGRIASYYYLSHLTMRMVKSDMRNEMSIEEILEMMSTAQEYDQLPVRHNEDVVNSELAKKLDVKFKFPSWDLPSSKTLLLLFAHFSRVQLPSTDYVTDLKSVLDQAIRVLQALVDVSADHGWIVTSLRCMHVVQMITQASWHHCDDLSTLPHTEQDTLQNLRIDGRKVTLAILANKARTRGGAMELSSKLAPYYRSHDHVDKIVAHVQKLPVVSVSLSLQLQQSDDPHAAPERKIQIPSSFGSSILKKESWTEVKAGCEYLLGVSLKRIHSDVRKTDDKALAPRFGKAKLEGWFLLLCNRDTRELIALKRISTLRNHANEVLLFCTPEQMRTKVVLTLMLVSDSYIGLDQLYDVRLAIN